MLSPSPRYSRIEEGARGAARGRYSALAAQLRHFFKYSQVGLASLATDVGVYSLLHVLGVEPLLSNCVSRPAGGLVCFALNKYWTFGNRGRKRVEVQFLRFWCVFGVSLLLSQVFLGILYYVMGGDRYVAKLTAEGLVFVFNFLCLKYWTFR